MRKYEQNKTNLNILQTCVYHLVITDKTPQWLLRGTVTIVLSRMFFQNYIHRDLTPSYGKGPYTSRNVKVTKDI